MFRAPRTAAELPLLETFGVEPSFFRRALRSDFMRDGAIVFASTMFVNVLNYAIHFILSRRLGVVDYGIFTSLLSALVIVGMPAAFITLVIVKFTAEFNAVGDRAKIRILSTRVLGLGAILGCVGILLAVALKGEIASYLRFTDTGSIIMAAVVLAIGFTLPAMRGVLQGTQDFVALAISTSIEALGKISLAVAFVYLGWGVSGIFVGYAIAGICSFLYTIFVARRHWDFGPALVAIDARRLFQSTGAIVLGTSAITLMGFIDVPLVKHFFVPTTAGLYGAISICGKILLFIVGFIPMLVLPKAAQRAAAGRTPVSVLWQGVGVTLIFAVCGLVAFLLIPQFIVRVTFGAAFMPAARYIFAYGVAMSFLALTNVVVTYKIALHRFDFVLPLLAAVVLEPVGIYLFHTSLSSVITVVIAVTGFALLLTLLRLPVQFDRARIAREA